MSSSNINTDPVSERKKLYISQRHIPALFEALMAGLMSNEPDDHLEYIIDSLSKVKNQKLPIKWDTFIEMNKK